MTSNAPNTAFQSTELIPGEVLLTVIDNLDVIIPPNQQKYTVKGKLIDQKKVLCDMLAGTRDGKLSVSYFYSKNSETHGRLFARGGRSMQSLSRVIRHTLAANTYNDYDIKNCHPTIALHYCETMKGMDVPNLKYYVENREQVFQDIIALNPTMTADEVKTVFIAMLNGGSGINRIPYKNEFVWNFQYEMQRAFRDILAYPENQGLVEEARKTHTKEKLKGEALEDAILRTVVNKVFVDIEKDVLNTWLRWVDINVHPDATKYACLMFDGMMIPKQYKFPDGWEQSVSDYVAKHSESRIRMTYLQKPMLEGYDLSKLPLSHYDVTQYTSKVDTNLLYDFAYDLSDDFMVKIVYAALGEKYRWTGDSLWVFDNHSWRDYGDSTFTKDVVSLRPLYGSILGNISPDDTDYKAIKSAYKAFGSISCIQRLRVLFKDMVHQPDFISTLDMKPTLIGFPDGVYDINEGQFRPGRPEDLISRIIPIPYQKPDNNKRAEDLLRGIIGSDHYDTFVALLASLLIGGNPYHRIDFLVGDGANGKSIILKLLQRLFGSYATQLDKTLLICAKKHAGGPEPHLMALRGARFAYVSETDPNDVMMAPVIKGLGSGDAITARGMHENRMTTFIPQFKFFIATNYLPKFSAVDDGIYRRLRILTFPYKFVDGSDARVQGTPTDTKDGYWLSADGLKLKKRDYSLEHTIQTDDSYVMEMFHLLADHCKGKTQIEVPETAQMVSDRLSYIHDLNPLAEWFSASLVASTIPEQWHTTTYLLNDYNKYMTKQGGKTLSATMFGRHLRTFGKCEKHGKVGLMKLWNYTLLPKEEDADSDKE